MSNKDKEIEILLTNIGPDEITNIVIKNPKNNLYIIKYFKEKRPDLYDMLINKGLNLDMDIESDLESYSNSNLDSESDSDLDSESDSEFSDTSVNDTPEVSILDFINSMINNIGMRALAMQLKKDNNTYVINIIMDNKELYDPQFIEILRS